MLPILLCGCENWVLTEDILLALEKFQGEIGRRILKLSKLHSTLAVRVALQWPSLHARILVRKLFFLKRVVDGSDGVSSEVFKAIAMVNVNSIQLVKECRYLEEYFHTNFTSNILQNNEVCKKELKEVIFKNDWNQSLQKAHSHCSTIIIEVTSWMKIWDVTLDEGPRGTKSMLALLYEITTPFISTCQFCGLTELDLSLFHHLMEDHRDKYISVREDPEEITRLLINIHSESSIFMWHKFFTVV